MFQIWVPRFVCGCGPTDRPHSSCHPSFLFLFRNFMDSCTSFLVACWPLRSNTEPEDVLEAALFPEAWSASFLNNSCDSDIEHELPPELTDNPLQIILFPLLVNRGSWPVTHSQEHPWFSQTLSSDRTAGVSASNCTVTNWFKSWTNTRASSWACALLH